MDVQTLSVKMQEKELLTRLLGNYVGHMAIGVFKDPTNYNILSFRLRVTWDDISSFPTVIDVGGEKIPVRVEGGYLPRVATNWLESKWFKRPEHWDYGDGD